MTPRYSRDAVCPDSPYGILSVTFFLLASAATCFSNFFFTPLDHTLLKHLRSLYATRAFVSYLSSLMDGLANLRLGWVCLGMELRVVRNTFILLINLFLFSRICIIIPGRSPGFTE